MARVPLYKAAETEMLRRITEGEWEVGKRLPNEFGLADEFGVSQGTMRRALISVESMGLLARKPGRGTVVARATPNSGSAMNGANGGADLKLRATDGAPVRFDVHRAKTDARQGRTDDGAHFAGVRLLTMERLLMRDGTRAGIETFVIPASTASDLSTDAPADFPGLLDAHGVGYAQIVMRIGAAVSSMSESVTLSCDRHAALFVITEDAVDGSGAPMARRTLRVLGAGLACGVT